MIRLHLQCIQHVLVLQLVPAAVPAACAAGAMAGAAAVTNTIYHRLSLSQFCDVLPKLVIDKVMKCCDMCFAFVCHAMQLKRLGFCVWLRQGWKHSVVCAIVWFKCQMP